MTKTIPNSPPACTNILDPPFAGTLEPEDEGELDELDELGDPPFSDTLELEVVGKLD